MSGTVDRVHDSDAAVPLGRSIGRTHKFLRAWVDEELAPLDSSVTEYIVLFHIDGAAAPAPARSRSPASPTWADRRSCVTSTASRPTASSSAAVTAPTGG